MTAHEKIRQADPLATATGTIDGKSFTGRPVTHMGYIELDEPIRWGNFTRTRIYSTWLDEYADSSSLHIEPSKK
jgi:hypothetical protein